MDTIRPQRQLRNQKQYPEPDADEEEIKSGGGKQTNRSVQLPFSATEWATLSARFPLTGLQWDQMLAVLNVMKPALVNADAETKES